MKKLVRRKIAVFTGTRAEYGLLYWVIKALDTSPDIELQLMVGGMHLSHEFGFTVSQIERDGLQVTERLEFLLSSDTPVGISKSMGLALISAAESLDRQKPDILVVLGDRFESLAVAQAAMIACIPIAHIHGGESTEGLIDEAIRHSITKLAQVHFTATDKYRRRVIQLGEQPHRVFDFGAPGIDTIKRLELLKRDDLGHAIDFDLSSSFFLITYHPVTLEKDGALQSLYNLLDVLDLYQEHKLVITYPNADTCGRGLLSAIEKYRHLNPERVFVTSSLGQLRYLSLMKYCDAVIGNSSSGLIEAPSFKVPTVNIGNRQKGRVAGATVIHADDTFDGISEALRMATSREFIEVCRDSTNPYGNGEASEKIVSVLSTIDTSALISKSFLDIEYSLQ